VAIQIPVLFWKLFQAKITKTRFKLAHLFHKQGNFNLFDEDLERVLQPERLEFEDTSFQ
jgi:hypothetical protein